VNSLSDLGLTVDETGQMSFDSTTYSAANSASIQQFLGTTTTGGFLETANNDLQTMTDPNTGLLQGESNTLQTQVTTENGEIADDQTRISDLTTNLQSELSAADAAIASLQSQNTYFQELFQATYGTNGTSTTG
jgi:flagellar capping protein FliD